MVCDFNMNVLQKLASTQSFIGIRLLNRSKCLLAVVTDHAGLYVLIGLDVQ
jgi:hypothetical protein